MQITEVKTIGILGAGRVGTAIARRAIAAGYAVKIATSKSPAEIALLLEIMVPGAVATTAQDAIAESDIVILALPLSKYRQLQPELLAGKIVIDAMNYWAPTDGTIPEFETGTSSSEVIQKFLSQSRLVRSFNHMGYHEIDEEARPSDDPQRRALAIAGNDAEARKQVAGFVDRIGFDPVDAGPLIASRMFDTGTPVFGAPLTRETMTDALTLQQAV
ncbi:NADPH-dependent F420 reductase [Ochrobactrum sp. SFR4]|uniref:NADPH-dependent F420 reductase n=1 Tax=Ochrobactrum sp. SFR4 TaxID=2717368 RepID=UPI001C8B71B1|nr:NADPH-dependent F420 reductase [Ochrobactrum sp. SFR4]MBX8825444.1 NADPH-dependent F420 reductase [Ochrobactrum sp. SFR4]